MRKPLGLGRDGSHKWGGGDLKPSFWGCPHSPQQLVLGYKGWVRRVGDK